MNKLTSKIIDDILKIDITENVFLLGDYVASDLFGRMALAINIDGRADEVLFLRDASKQTIQNQLLQLTEIIGTLEDLEKKNYLLVVEADEEQLTNVLFYKRKTQFNGKQLPHEYIISDQLVLTTNIGEPIKILDNENVILEGKKVSQILMLSIKRLFCSRVLPTKALLDYKKRGYKTLEEFNTNKGLKFSVISMIIALIIAVLTPVGTLLLGNRYSISTLNSNQFDSILHVTRNVRMENSYVNHVCYQADSCLRETGNNSNLKFRNNNGK